MLKLALDLSTLNFGVVMQSRPMTIMFHGSDLLPETDLDL